MNINELNYSGVYLITNELTGEFYGGSSGNIQKRWRQHINSAIRGHNKCAKLHSAMKKYGIENFSIKTLIRCSPENLLFFEQRWLDANTENINCYNISKFADNPTRGRSLSDNHKQALRKPKSVTFGMGHKTGTKLSPEHKQNIGNALRGKKYKCDRRGENAANSKLTTEQVQEIRQLYIPRKVSYTILAKMFGVHPNTIKNIVKNYYWTNL